MKKFSRIKNEVLYTVRVPYDMTGQNILVYWSHDEQAWDWCVVDADDNIVRPATLQQYGSAEPCLRDALVELTR